MTRPAVLFWGHEPRANGWTDPGRLGGYMYDTGTGEGLQWRVPNAPFVMETFCMGDHRIVSGYRKDGYGTIRPEVLSPRNAGADAWDSDCTGQCCTSSPRRSSPMALAPGDPARL